MVPNEVGHDPGIDQAYAVRTFGSCWEGREGACIRSLQFYLLVFIFIYMMLMLIIPLLAPRSNNYSPTAAVSPLLPLQPAWLQILLVIARGAPPCSTTPPSSCPTAPSLCRAPSSCLPRTRTSSRPPSRSRRALPGLVLNQGGPGGDGHAEVPGVPEFVRALVDMGRLNIRGRGMSP